MKSLQNVLHHAHVAFQRASQAETPVLTNRATKFVEPSSPTWIRHHRTWHPQGYYKLFCAHDVPRFKPCSQCRRTTSEAKKFSL